MRRVTKSTSYTSREPSNERSRDNFAFPLYTLHYSSDQHREFEIFSSFKLRGVPRRRLDKQGNTMQHPLQPVAHSISIRANGDDQIRSNRWMRRRLNIRPWMKIQQFAVFVLSTNRVLHEMFTSRQIMHLHHMMIIHLHHIMIIYPHLGLFLLHRAVIAHPVLQSNTVSD